MKIPSKVGPENLNFIYLLEMNTFREYHEKFSETYKEDTPLT